MQCRLLMTFANSSELLCILGSSLKVKEQNWGYFLGLQKFQIFFGVLEIPDIFGG